MAELSLNSGCAKVWADAVASKYEHYWNHEGGKERAERAVQQIMERDGISRGEAIKLWAKMVGAGIGPALIECGLAFSEGREPNFRQPQEP